MTVLRRSLQDIFEHSLEDKTIWEWLQTFDITSLSSMRYWVNVKNHKNFGEVVYVIEHEKPIDIITGHKKK